MADSSQRISAWFINSTLHAKSQGTQRRTWQGIQKFLWKGFPFWCLVQNFCLAIDKVSSVSSAIVPRPWILDAMRLPDTFKIILCSPFPAPTTHPVFNSTWFRHPWNFCLCLTHQSASLRSLKLSVFGPSLIEDDELSFLLEHGSRRKMKTGPPTECFFVSWNVSRGVIVLHRTNEGTVKGGWEEFVVFSKIFFSAGLISIYIFF